MDLSRQEYPLMLAGLQPAQAVTVMGDRVKHINKTNTDIADWLLERRKIEDQYVQGLRRLAKIRPVEDEADLGIFDTPWRKIRTAADSLADAHHNFARKIESDVERPLREFASSNRQMQALSTIQGNLTSMAKDYDNAQRKSEKVQGKAGKTAINKAADISSEVDAAASQWESQAPYIFESFQAADESRCNHLRDVLTQLQTHEVDQAQKTQVTAEQCLNALLNVETADEIKTFSIKHGGNAGGVATQRMEKRPSREPPRSALAPPPPTSPPNGDDAASLRSSSVAEVPEEKKSRLGGLKRLGTVMSRRRQSTQPAKPPSKSKQSTLEPISDETREAPGTSSGSYLQARSSRQQPPRTFSDMSDSIPTTSTRNNEKATDPVPNGNTELQAPLQPQPQVPTPSLQPQSQLPSETSSHMLAGPDASDVQNQTPSLSPSQSRSAAPRVQAPLQPDVLYQPQPQFQLQSQPQSNFAPSFAADNEVAENEAEFVPPPTSLDPISAAEQEAAGTSEGSQPYKLDIRSAPIAEESTDAQAAMASVASTLRSQAAPSRRTGTLRGRRDVRNTVFVPSLSETPQAGSGAATALMASNLPASGLSATSPPALSPQISALQSSGHRPLSSEDHSDTQSIRSATSLGPATAIKHPDMHGPGINASIVETVSAWFEKGGVSRAVVIGELALAHTPNLASSQNVSNIRLEHFQILEKVAPNPSFISQLSQDKPGEYAVDLAALGGSGRPAVAFKYQVHLNDNALTKQAPLLLNPAWKVEPTQTSVILSYSLNPAFSADPVSFSNIVLVVHLEGAQASTCQSKPAGTFSKERNIIYWRLGDLALQAEAAPARILARFATEGQAKPGKIEARWEINGTGGSGLGVGVAEGASDPFADVSTVAFRPIKPVRKLVSGTYSC